MNVVKIWANSGPSLPLSPHVVMVQPHRDSLLLLAKGIPTATAVWLVAKPPGTPRQLHFPATTLEGSVNSC